MLGITFLNACLVGLCVTIHYEFLYRCSHWMPGLRATGRYRILTGVFVALAAHVAEVWLFALGYFFALNAEGLGNLIGNFSGSLSDCLYFSFTTYTTLGYGPNPQIETPKTQEALAV